MMEIAGVILACIAAGAFGFFAGGRWAPSPFLGALMGIPLGVFFAVIYFVLSVWVGETWPHSLDPHRIGIYSVLLVGAGAVCGAIGAWFGYRKSLGARLF